jgi:AcrR family transcriptional regulator
MPTGVALRDPRQQLFDAAERILLRDGPNALTSRAVTDEAGCAKGVLHRHFDDFDGFLLELVGDRIRRVRIQDDELRERAGCGTVAGNLIAALTEVFDPLALAVLGLITARDELRTRLRQTTPVGLPVLTEAGVMIKRYLTAERELGRIQPQADVDTLALTLIGAGHLLFAGREHAPQPDGAVDRIVASVMSGVLTDPDGR